MVPLSDASRRPSRVPFVTFGIIVINIFVFVLEMLGGQPFVLEWSVVPADIVAGHRFMTILTAMFLHAGLAHILGNMIFLRAFGPEIEDAMGPLRYLGFYIIGGFAATLAQVATDPGSVVPSLGASGAIAGVMGAFLITYPRDQIKTVIFLGWYVTVTVIPAGLLVGFWFLTQLFSEIGAVATVQHGGVAYMAHIGGFITGLVTARFFEDQRRLTYRRLGE
jgi:membrane associated rhomboid family serine protease